ncbi:MAG: IS256 family transposase [Desulfovibrio sp.]|nr:IS256 family transposase [Desulfovibrio sp.]
MQAADAILRSYDIKSAEDINCALKEVFGSIFERVLNAEMTTHLGFNKSEYGEKDTTNRRNGHTKKTVRTTSGEVSLEIPRDRDGTFTPVILPKYKKDVSDLERKVLAMYARGMSQRDISQTINDIYGFELSHEHISTITDLILEDVKEWQNRPLKPLYSFVFVDCIFASVRPEHGSKSMQQAVYVMLGVDIDGYKDVLGIWVNPTESKSYWMNVFDSIKQRGVQDILFLSMDGISGLEEGVKSIYKDTIVQRCLVHLIRNSLKYVSNKDYKEFCTSIKNVYKATSVEECQDNFVLFKEKWSKKCLGAVRVWDSHFEHVLQLFDYPSDIRHIMYTTNAIESVNSSLRKVTKKGSFDSPDALKKVFYLRIQELLRKWSRPISNWARVRNQLILNEKFEKRIKDLM